MPSLCSSGNCRASARSAILDKDLGAYCFYVSCCSRVFHAHFYISGYPNKKLKKSPVGLGSFPFTSLHVAILRIPFSFLLNSKEELPYSEKDSVASRSRAVSHQKGTLVQGLRIAWPIGLCMLRTISCCCAKMTNFEM